MCEYVCVGDHVCWSVCACMWECMGGSVCVSVCVGACGSVCVSVCVCELYFKEPVPPSGNPLGWVW